jgi:hypothetical protein
VAGRREGEQQRMPRTQCRIRRGTDVASLRIEGAWAAKAPNLDRVRPSAGARAARRDLRGGAGDDGHEAYTAIMWSVLVAA